MNKFVVNYAVEGQGPPVVLVHGIASSLADWRRLTPLLVSAGYQALALDLLGHGDSAKPDDPRQYSTQVIYAALEEWIDYLDLERPFYLVGHSLGGYLSLTYARNHPERVRAMVLLNPLYSCDQIARKLDIFMPLAPVGVSLLKAAPQWLVNSFLSYNDTFLTKLDAETRWAYARDIKRASPNILRIPATAPDLTPHLPSIRPDTLVLWGLEDRIEKVDTFPDLVSALPHAQGQGIADCGHHPHQGKPEVVSRLILDFFQQHPSQRAEGAPETPAPRSSAMKTDDETTVGALREAVAAFVDARDWQPFHGPKNLSMSIAIEAAELMEHFQWLTTEEAQTAVQDPAELAAVADELADVVIYCLGLSNALDLDLSSAVRAKLQTNEQRFPADEFRGRSREPERDKG